MRGATPYKGLVPYDEEDAPFFFGRDAEREIIIANLMASRLTLLYGACGVGKTSVLGAGVVYHLNQLARQNLAECGTPEFAVVVFKSWHDDPIVGLTKSIRASVATFFSAQAPALVLPSLSFTKTLEEATKQLGGELLIILDQFEEYFLYHGQEDGEGTFATEFPRAINHPDLRVSFLISIREDAVAKLDRFKARIPQLFDNYLRLEHLDREAARKAIIKPVEKYNQLHVSDGQPVSVEESLVETVLDQVQTGKVVLGESGRGIVGNGTAKVQVEAPFLQLVMERLWEEEVKEDSRNLRLSTLVNWLGGAKHIVRTHLDAKMQELLPEKQEVAAHIFNYLVTPTGTKIAHTIPDLAAYAGLPQAQLGPVLEHLSY